MRRCLRLAMYELDSDEERLCEEDEEEANEDSEGIGAIVKVENGSSLGYEKRRERKGA